MALCTSQFTVCWSGRGLNTETRTSYLALGAALSCTTFRAFASLVGRSMVTFRTEYNLACRTIHSIRTRWICEAAKNDEMRISWVLSDFDFATVTLTYVFVRKSMHSVRMWRERLLSVFPIRWKWSRRLTADIVSRYSIQVPMEWLCLWTPELARWSLRCVTSIGLSGESREQIFENEFQCYIFQ